MHAARACFSVLMHTFFLIYIYFSFNPNPQFQRPFDDFHAITAKLRREVLSPFIKKTSR